MANILCSTIKLQYYTDIKWKKLSSINCQSDKELLDRLCTEDTRGKKGKIKFLLAKFFTWSYDGISDNLLSENFVTFSGWKLSVRDKDQ